TTRRRGARRARRRGGVQRPGADGAGTGRARRADRAAPRGDRAPRAQPSHGRGSRARGRHAAHPGGGGAGGAAPPAAPQPSARTPPDGVLLLVHPGRASHMADVTDGTLATAAAVVVVTLVPADSDTAAGQLEAASALAQRAGGAVERIGASTLVAAFPAV